MQATSPAQTAPRTARDPGEPTPAARSVWARPGRVHIGTAGGQHSPAADHRAHLIAAAQAVPGVHWAAVNEVLGRVIVDFDPRRTSAAEVIAAVTGSAAADDGPAGSDAPPAYPGDRAPAVRAAATLAGLVVGGGAGLVGRALRLPAIAGESMAALAAVDAMPGLRSRLENRFGGPVVGWGLGAATAVVSAAAQTPATPLAEAAVRVVQLREALARQRVWQRREPHLCADAVTATSGRVVVPARPAPLPDGPVQRHVRRMGRLVPAAAVATGMWGGLRRAAQAVMVGTPRTATAGQEAYAAQVGRLLAEHDTVVRDATALRRLDRIDTVLIDAAVLLTGRWTLTGVTIAGDADGEGADETAVRNRLADLLDGARPGETVHRGRWSLGPPAALGVTVPDELPDRRSDTRTVALVRNGRLVAAATVEAELHPLADAVVQAARAVGTLMVAGRGSGLGARLGVEVLPGGSRMAASVRGRQAAGAGVLLVAGRNDTALAAADCGIGVVRPGHRPPWGAHLLAGADLGEVWLALEATALARRASERSAQLALLGTASGALFSVAGPATGAGRRVGLPVSLATLAAVGAATWSVSGLARRPAPVPPDTTAWHALPLAEIWRRLRTSAAGLDPGQAAARRRGDTDDGSAGQEGLLRATVAELDSPLTGPLTAGAGISAATGAVSDATLVGGVLAASAALSGVQRVTANRALRQLEHTTALRVRLRRGGVEAEAPADDLVPGDVILVAAGDAVPADCRLIDATGLEMDESALTGESLPVAKSGTPTAATAVAERTSMLFAGTTVAAGTGTAVVVATGAATEAGRGAHGAGAFQPAGGVEARLQKLTAASVPVAVGAAGVLLGAGALRGRLGRSVGEAVALAVAAVPEGLPFVATVAQLAAARRLSRRNVLVRNPRTMEALGRVDVVCFDKTGTLTEGRIRLRRVSDGSHDQACEQLSGHHRDVLAAGLRATPAPETGQVLPHPTDRAVAEAGEHCGVLLTDHAPGWQMRRELPFEPGRGFHAVLGEDRNGRRISVKGAPEAVLPRCVRRCDERGERAIGDGDRADLEAHVEQLARQGYRVLAVAERAASARKHLDDERIDQLTFLGLLALADPVRPTAAEAVRQLRAAGVDIAMLTGDHPSTAAAIAAELGILNGHRPVTGPEIDACTSEELAKLVAEATVFARVSPAHKVTLVRALRRAGRVVAVTGDGANDAPAIRLAEVGIALGDRGTTAAREAADIVITDDRIETIVHTVIEGRALWMAVRDSVALLLGGNLGEIAFTVTSALLSPRPPLGARQLLLVNLVTDLLPALALAARPPRHVSAEELLHAGPDAALGADLNRDIAVRAAATALAATGGWLAARLTGTAGRASTVALASLVGAQLAQTALAARGDPLVLAAAIGSGVVLAGLIQFPPTSLFFGSRPLGPVAWAIVLAASGAGGVLGRLGNRLPIDTVRTLSKFASVTNPTPAG
ncbi:HAD-IC family P-type ATPase [Krasilnikovia sp. MM14-A1004]|uniref:HAD-IC family P-type ATPase n=1 Tax=Krasilnikovia sp. MM14-A1004 TaxID=3373541 RepID=UPI00399CC2D7